MNTFNAPTAGSVANDVPEDDGVDFMELASTPSPEAVPHFERRVQVVVRALDGLDRREIHYVLERAGTIARAARVKHEQEKPR